MTIVSNSKCPFCKSPAKFLMGNGDRPVLYSFDCQEVCGLYSISAELFQKIKDDPINNGMLNCISENINCNSRGEDKIVTSWHRQDESSKPNLAPNITIKIYESFFRIPIVHADKVRDLLMLVAEKLSNEEPFSSAEFTLRDCYKLKIKDPSEAARWLGELESEGWAKWYRLDETNKGLSVTLTPSGWKQVFQNRRSINSKTVFIAMQFDWKDLDSVRTQFISSVKGACKDCGYEAWPINDRDHINQITDEIVANIKASRFVIADFTFNNRGAYFEAGLARGLDIPVIHTVRSGHTEGKAEGKKLHFDVKQINYLEWSDPGELQKQLINRIKAVIEK